MTANSKQTAVPDTSSFSCGVIPETIGVNIPISSKDKHKFDRPKKDTVISKHRKWLSDLQRKKEMLESQYLNEIAQKKDQQDKFTEREASLRKIANSMARRDGETMADDKEQRTMQESLQSKQNDAKAEDKNSSATATGTISEAKGARPTGIINEAKGAQPKNTVIISNISDSKMVTAPGGSRPAWALTETAAAVASEEKLLGDEDDLLDFAASLDFDRYMGDVEVRVMIDRLRRRIVDLEREAVQEEGRDAAQEERAAKKDMLTKMIEDAMALGAQQEEKSEMEQNIAAARAILHTDEGSDLQNIHSAKSVTAIIKMTKDKLNSGPMVLETSKVYNEPVVVSYDPEEGARLAKNAAVANLPYMHRNPAV